MQGSKSGSLVATYGISEVALSEYSEFKFEDQEELHDFVVSVRPAHCLLALQGVVLRPKFSRGGHVFEVPILLSTTVSDYRVAAAAYILPPAISLMVKFWIVKPLRRRAKLQKVLLSRLSLHEAFLGTAISPFRETIFLHLNDREKYLGVSAVMCEIASTPSQPCMCETDHHNL